MAALDRMRKPRHARPPKPGAPNIAPPAKLERAIALHRQGRLIDAERLYGEVLTVRPDDFDALHLMGVICAQTGRAERAIELIGMAIAVKPDAPAALDNLGNALRTANRMDDALAAYDRAIALEPAYTSAHNHRAGALLTLGRPDEALASYDRAIALNPDHAEAHRGRGNALRDMKRLEQALASYDRAIALSPVYVEAHNSRGMALRALGRREEAIASYDKAIALKPDFAQVHNNRANVLRELNRLPEALAGFDKAIALDPRFAEAYNNRGTALASLNRLEEALGEYQKAIDLEPAYADPHWNRSCCLLLMGRFEEGWPEHEWRKRRDEPMGLRRYAQPLWLGEDDIRDKVLFVYWEQGLGDTIQFSRYVSLAAGRGAKVFLSVQEPLRTLLGQLNPHVRVLGPNEVPARFDYHCPLLSLPVAFRTTLDTIPAPRQYLTADPGLGAVWAARLPPGTKPRIGLVWSGNTDHKNDHNRSLQLEALLPVLDFEAHWVCLQKEVRPGDREVLAATGSIAVPGEQLGDFSDTAALVDLMDLVITVDTSVAHLAGAMGKPVWLLLPYNPDWRWLLDRQDSPWYPSARLFRQQRIGDWAGVIDEVKAALRREPFDRPLSPPGA